jgi:hypothetical protein
MDRTKSLIQYPGKERFFSEQKMINQKKFYGLYMENGKKVITRNSYKYDSTTSSEQS